MIKKPSIITGNDCKIYFDQIDLPLRSRKNITPVITGKIDYQTPYDVSQTDLIQEKLIKLLKIINEDELMQTRLSLDYTVNLLSTIQFHRDCIAKELCLFCVKTEVYDQVLPSVAYTVTP